MHNNKVFKLKRKEAYIVLYSPNKNVKHGGILIGRYAANLDTALIFVSVLQTVELASEDRFVLQPVGFTDHVAVIVDPAEVYDIRQLNYDTLLSIWAVIDSGDLCGITFAEFKKYFNDESTNNTSGWKEGNKTVH